MSVAAGQAPAVPTAAVAAVVQQEPRMTLEATPGWARSAGRHTAGATKARREPSWWGSQGSETGCCLWTPRLGKIPEQIPG